MKTLSPSLIVALDQLSLQQAEVLVDKLSAVGVSWFKVGLELFSKAGPAFVTHLKNKNLKVFLDLKFHDIPTTVEKAVAASVDLGADLLTIHASGADEMMKAAKRASGSSTKIVGVTVLTSLTDDDTSFLFGVDRKSAAFKMAKRAAESGLDGIVSSVNDLSLEIQRSFSGRGIFVTPGIRGSSDRQNDQKSIATPLHAVRSGATHLVVGRPITQPEKGDSAAAAEGFLKAIKDAQ